MLAIFSSPFFRYVLVGLANVLVCVIVMSMGARWGLPYLYYTPLGYGVAMLNSYVCNGLFTFDTSRLSVRQLSLFFIINGLSLLTVEALEYGMIDWLNCPEPISVGLGMSWYTLVGYVLNKRIVYAT